MSHEICAGINTLFELKRVLCIPVKLNIFTMLESADRYKENGKEERKNILCEIYLRCVCSYDRQNNLRRL